MRDRIPRVLLLLLVAAGLAASAGDPVAHNLAMLQALRAVAGPRPPADQEFAQLAGSLRSISGEGSAANALGMIYFQRDDIASAVQAFRGSRTPAPCDIAASLRSRANHWASEDRLSEAERAYRVVLDLCPGPIEDRLALARVLNAQGALPEASEVLAEAAALAPEGEAVHFEALGQLYLWRHQWPQALSAYRQAVTMQPHRADYSATLAYAIYEVEGGGEALRYLAGAARDERDWMWGLSLYATLLFAEGRCEEGEAQMQRAVAQGLPQSNAQSLKEAAAKCIVGAPVTQGGH
jgi:tetratricopeptide (TPR) repeat protein